MPFGLSLAPFMMQIMANYIAAAFRKFGVYAWIHIDDLIAAHDDQALLKRATRVILDKLKKSMIKLNPYKSVIVPSRCVVFLGATWTKDRIVRAPSVDEHIQKALSFIAETNLSSVPLKRIQMLAGFLNYYLVFAGRPYFIITFFLKNYINFNQHKEWWLLIVNQLAKYNTILFEYPQELEKVLHVDASPQAIGICYEDNSWGCTIENPCKQAPIYAAEIVACFHGLLEVQRRAIIGETFKWIKTDNVIALAFFQKAKGRMQYASNRVLCWLSAFSILVRKLVQVEFVYVKSEENKADIWSRPNELN